jgi:hypothetical protein
MLFLFIETEFMRAGCPADRTIRFTLADAARAMGYGVLGGSERKTARRALKRLNAVSIDSAVQTRFGLTGVLVWSLMDAYACGEDVRVRVSQEVAYLITHGCVTFYDQPTLGELLRRDLVAARLWVFLESERLDKLRRYRMFGAEPEDPAENWLPPITRLLGLRDAKRSRVLTRLGRAFAVIGECDRCYSLSVRPSADGNDWILLARKRARGTAPVDSPPARRKAPDARANDGRSGGQMGPGVRANDGRSGGQMGPGVGANEAPGPARNRPYRRRTSDSTDAYSVVSDLGDTTLSSVPLAEWMRRSGMDERLLQQLSCHGMTDQDRPRGRGKRDRARENDVVGTVRFAQRQVDHPEEGVA